jgi:RimJ/RimL family protein N-acetyltransferase
VPKGEIGYWLSSGRTGPGLMREAVNALTELLIGSLKFNRVEIQADVHNHRSHRVAELCGYQLDGTLRCDSLAPDGSLRSTRVYSRIAAG